MQFNKKKYYQQKIFKLHPNVEYIFSKKRPVIIWPSAHLGQQFESKLRQHNIKSAAFVDSSKEFENKKINNIEVYSPSFAYRHYSLNPIIIASVLYGHEIFKSALKQGFKYIYSPYFLYLVKPLIFSIPYYHKMFDSLFIKKNQQKIKSAYALFSDTQSKKLFRNIINYRLTADYQYLLRDRSTYQLFGEQEILNLNTAEIFLDCGAYDGDTIKMFIDTVKGKYKHIYGFEPDKKNYYLMTKQFIKNINIDLINKAIYSKNDFLFFEASGKYDSKIAEVNNDIGNNLKIHSISIDDYFKNKTVPTLIKMDIEGAEIEALKGAKNTILKHKPKLAISIYHKYDDLWKIILLIHSLNSNYKFYLRHFSIEMDDLVIYAV